MVLLKTAKAIKVQSSESFPIYGVYTRYKYVAIMRKLMMESD